MDCIDLLWMGRPGLIGTWRFGDTLVDSGPMTTVDRLIEVLGDDAPRRLLLTHIHFDHAGAAGALVERYPGLEVVVHRTGARHLLDPSRLIASARRVFGDALDERFGEMSRVPEASLRVIDGGETLDGIRTAYTPGHASHHVSFLDEASGTAFCGDVAGVLVGGMLVPPMPPPDVDLDLWRSSLHAVGAWRPERLALAHFGSVDDDVPGHLARMRATLEAHEDHARGDEAAYLAWIEGTIHDRGGDALLDDFRLVAPPSQNHVGLRRWLQREAA